MAKLAPIYLNAMTVDRAPLEVIFRSAAAAGFRGIELWAHHIVPDRLTAADLDGLQARYGPPVDISLTPRHVADLASEYNIKIDGVVPGFDFMVNWIDDLSEQRLRDLQSMLPSFKEIGARYIVLPVLSGSGEGEAQQAIATSLCRVCEVLAPFDLIAGLEPIGHIPRLSRIEDALAVLDQVPGHLQAGLVLDAFHFFRAGHRLDDLSSIPLQRIVAVQINDAEDRPLQELWGHKHRLHPGHGIFDVAGFCNALLARGYDGPFVSEVMNEKYWHQDIQPLCAEAYAACCAVLGQQPIH